MKIWYREEKKSQKVILGMMYSFCVDIIQKLYTKNASKVILKEKSSSPL
jgi:hypothetical protein